MPDAQNDWVAKRVETAHIAYPVADAVILTIKTQLKETMRERALRPAELATLAKTLLDAMNNPPGEEAAK